MAKFQPIDEAAFNKVSARDMRNPLPLVLSVFFVRRSHKVKLELSTGIELSFDPRDAHGLEEASPDDLDDVRVEGAGNTIYFPKLDADFSVPRLLEGFLGPLNWTRRERRAEASRENGKLGGRPRKERAEA